MSSSKLKTALYAILPLVGLAGITVGGCGNTIDQQDDDHLGATEQALTAAQCNYFAVNGKVQICHRTGSTKNPFTILKVSEQACVNAHAGHAGDYVAVNDPQCKGTGCLPANAPCDPTVPCCDGFSCVNGTCTQNISDHCNPSPCQNGGSCVNNASGYTCACPAGYTGTNCETEIDECASNPCQHGGTCLDGINAYVCQCDPGWSGTNCETLTATCPCTGTPVWYDWVNASNGIAYAEPGIVRIGTDGPYGYVTGSACDIGEIEGGFHWITPAEGAACINEINAAHPITCTDSLCPSMNGACIYAGQGVDYTCQCYQPFYGPTCLYY